MSSSRRILLLSICIFALFGTARRGNATETDGQRVVKLIGYDNGPKDSRRAHELGNDAQYTYL